MQLASRPAAALSRLAPAMFVLLWASGFIVARLVRPFVEPETFVSARFALSAVVLAGIAWAGRAPWPAARRDWIESIVAGTLMQGVYVGGTFWSIKHGLSPAVAALISGLQPLFTGVLAGPLLHERVTARRWLGILIGFAGALLVLAPNLRGVAAVPASVIASSFVGMAGITFGTLWQKKIGASVDVRTGAALQLVGGVAVTLPLALTTEDWHFVNSPDLWIGLGWAVLVVSVATTLLLLSLLRAGAVARVTSLFYLVPPFTALMALVLFGEALVFSQIVGMAIAAVGVGIANRA